MNDFAIMYYSTPDGDVPMLDFLKNLDIKLRAKVLRDMALLKEYGNAVREPQSKYLAEGIFELRSKQSTNIARSLYFFEPNRTVVFTNGFVKKSTETPRSELDKAITRKIDWERRHR